MNKIVILDRDGVINAYPGDHDYVKSWQEFRFLPQTKEAIKLLNKADFKVYIASNQAGVTKGLFSKSALDDITSKLQAELSLSGAKIDGVYYCLHRDEDNCSCRKPKTGLLEQISPDKNETKCFIGDALVDIEAGANFGCPTILVLSGKTKSAKDTHHWPFKPNLIANNLLEAAQSIINKKI